MEGTTLVFSPLPAGRVLPLLRLWSPIHPSLGFSFSHSPAVRFAGLSVNPPLFADRLWRLPSRPRIVTLPAIAFSVTGLYAFNAAGFLPSFGANLVCSTHYARVFRLISVAVPSLIADS